MRPLSREREVPRSGKSTPKPRSAKAIAPIKHVSGRGLVVSTQARPFPQTPDAKVTCAKHIIQAVCTAHDSGPLEGQNFDIHWPLSLAVELLEQAGGQLDRESSKGCAA